MIHCLFVSVKKCGLFSQLPPSHGQHPPRHPVLSGINLSAQSQKYFVSVVDPCRESQSLKPSLQRAKSSSLFQWQLKVLGLPTIQICLCLWTEKPHGELSFSSILNRPSQSLLRTSFIGVGYIFPDKDEVAWGFYRCCWKMPHWFTWDTPSRVMCLPSWIWKSLSASWPLYICLLVHGISVHLKAAVSSWLRKVLLRNNRKSMLDSHEV